MKPIFWIIVFVAFALFMRLDYSISNEALTKAALQEYINRNDYPECITEKVREHFNKSDHGLLLAKTLRDIDSVCRQRAAVAKQKNELFGSEG